jgi:hypothetical protein
MNKDDTKHGVVVKEKKTGKIVQFLECEGMKCLYILSGVRKHLGSDYQADEDIMLTKDLQGVGQ